ncbi:MAG: D-sedoheptulose 7-phosphate isomerase [Deltaproteobacteria bacterium]|nr:D-sedoheptulose 7-phosphate isomerase [Deltaproteobacteria bacterium]
MKTRIRQHLHTLQDLQQRFIDSQTESLLQAAQWITESFRQGNKLMIMGNGGSAADAQHIAAEFVNRFLLDRPPLPALALNTDTSILTSIGNDFGFERIFEKQVLALGTAGDILLGISTSGNSPNILKGFQAAREKEVRTIALAGHDGGAMVSRADLSLIVASDQTPRIQEVHAFIGHLLCELVETAFFSADDIGSPYA